MIDRLRVVVEQAEQLAPEEQEALAAAWAEVLEEREWEAITRKPEVRGALERMAAEALEEDVRGETEEITGDSFV